MNFIYEGVEYAPGTKVIIETKYYGDLLMEYRSDPMHESGFASKEYPLAFIRLLLPTVNMKLVIVEPVYPEKKITVRDVPYVCPPSWDVEIGWVWYIIIMVLGSFPKDRVFVWIVATAYFFRWKSGLFNRNKE